MERGEVFVQVALLLDLLINPGPHPQRKFEPVMTVYESKPNLADHEKIQGLNENWSAPGT